MLPYEINGLPLHILLVHVVVIVLPAAGLMTALGSFWPAFRRKLGIVTPLVALIGLISVPLATNAGEWLEQRVASTPLVQAHVALGDTLLPWAIAQFLIAVVIWGWYRFFAAPRTVPQPPARNASVPVPAGGVPLVASSGTPSAGGTATTGHRAVADPYATESSEAAAPGTTVAPGAAASLPHRASWRVSVIVSIVLIVLGVGISAGTVVKVVQIGESGSNAVWQGSFSEDPLN
ncbi:hypothetical protein [Subtercola endophyticus]|uniref:hypothetical protein n=1 Tax=Subtercola endophyticus TaxID=2895559 RepID=UPI001E5F3618|nr:hypothetical protein [Subtercola endophyticus]UFS59011.1 hypothetical protein LQ955_18805 [Subtercola endophyticus]